MIKLVYKPVSLLVSVLSGILAGAIFKRIWKLAAREERRAPGHRRPPRLARVFMPAAALRRGVTRWSGPGAAEGAHKLTGVWPGENREQAQKAA